jgi:hypothetical protein
MAERTTQEVRHSDVQGLKFLRKIRPLLSRLRTVGTERDRAGNRRLFMDQYCALILMALFSPAIQSLRDLQRACTLDKVRKRLGVNRASLGSLSESVSIFDPAPFKEIAAELIAEMHPLRWVIKMFFRTFKQFLGCRHLLSCDHNGVEIQASCAMIVCMLILIYTGGVARALERAVEASAGMDAGAQRTRSERTPGGPK